MKLREIVKWYNSREGRIDRAPRPAESGVKEGIIQDKFLVVAVKR